MPLGEAVLSAFLQVLFDRLACRELLEVAQVWKVDAKLKKFVSTVSNIKAVIKEAEDKQVNNAAVKIWLEDLHDVVDEAEDALDEFATGVLRRKAEAKSHSSKLNLRSLFESLDRSVVSFKTRIVSKINEITERLEDIAKQRVVLGLGERFHEPAVLPRVSTTSLGDDDHVYGREGDVRKVISLLKSDDEAGVSVIPIVGLGGIGKTTVAQVVYNDKEVNTHFEGLKAWAFVSEDFDIVRITKAILESLGKSCDYTNLEPLQSMLRKKLMGRKCLLVLDDVWTENYDEWELLLRPVSVGSKGSKVIVTTRNENVAQTVRTLPIPICRLEELSDKDCWSIFARHANIDAKARRADFIKIGVEIVKKCKGLPLATKALAGLLRSKLDVDEWLDVLNSEVWDSKEQNHAILPALCLSYHFLPSDLKPCFAFCSIFPKGYEFEEEELVRLWTALEFVQAEGDKQIEEVGRKCFCVLLSRSLFQCSGGAKSRFIMHDLINDLARVVAGGSCFRLEGLCQNKTWEKVRHLSYILGRHDVKALRSNKSLRTFLPFHGGFQPCELAADITRDLLQKFLRLRVLSLSHYEITKLPESIGDLKHLRYLNLSHTRVKELPKATVTLSNLQTLVLYECRCLIKLPKKMGNLTSLRHLDMRGTTELQELPPGMGRLTNLQTLPHFTVSKNGGSGIEELGYLLHLRGELSILGLQNVEKGKSACLNRRQHLDKLALEWSSDACFLQDETSMTNVLDMLEPHRNIKNLSIKYYSGTRFSSWVGDPSFSSVGSLILSNCKNCTSLPPLGQLASLKELTIEGMDEVDSVDREFYGDCYRFQSLQTLKFKNMRVWKKWSPSGVEGDGGGEFPCLFELYLDNCPELSMEVVVPDLPSLTILEICNCKKLTMLPRLPTLEKLVLEECDQVILGSVIGLTSIAKLQIGKISNLESLLEGFLQHLSAEYLEIHGCSSLESFPVGELPTTLKQLKISDCSNLNVLPEGLIHKNMSLECLWIEGCPFTSFSSTHPGLLPSSSTSTSSNSISTPSLMLKVLDIQNCSNFVSLPDDLNNFSFLEKLLISNCPRFESFPEEGLPPKLTSLSISECKSLKSLPSRMHDLMLLQELRISSCDDLESSPEGGLRLPTSLRLLEIMDCKKLGPPFKWNLDELSSLRIFNLTN